MGGVEMRHLQPKALGVHRQGRTGGQTEFPRCLGPRRTPSDSPRQFIIAPPTLGPRRAIEAR